MRVIKCSVLAASLIGGAVVLSGASTASAATWAPALAPTGDMAGVHEVTHDPLARPGRYAPRYVAPRYHVRPGFRYHRPVIGFGLAAPRYYGPTIGFGITTPRFSFGLAVPHRHHAWYGYRRW